MEIDKIKLQEYYKQGDFENFFKEAKVITDFILIRTFKVFDHDRREEMSQECLENLWKKVIQNKIDPDKNLMSFIWTNSKNRVLEIFRKQRRRDSIAKFVSYEYSDFLDHKSYASYRYMDKELAATLLEGVI